MTKFYHGTTKRIAKKILSDQRFLESRNQHDWLGPGVYFYQECPEKALYWAEEFSIKKKFPEEQAAVIEVDISLAKTLDFAGSKALSTLQLFAKNLKVKNPAQSSPILRTIKDVRKKIFSGIVVDSDDFVGKNIDDYELILDMIAFINDKTTGSYDSVRAVFWEGMEIRKGSYFFDHTNIQLCIYGKTTGKSDPQERYVDFSSMPFITPPTILAEEDIKEVRAFKNKIRQPV